MVGLWVSQHDCGPDYEIIHILRESVLAGRSDDGLPKLAHGHDQSVESGSSGCRRCHGERPFGLGTAVMARYMLSE